jgi:hypothetical protein
MLEKIKEEEEAYKILTIAKSGKQSKNLHEEYCNPG